MLKISKTGSKLSYPAKLLLFGEYTVTLGSGALAVPYDGLSGKLEYGTGEEKSEGLEKLHIHLATDPNLAARFDLKRLEKDISCGLVFNSGIPEGYGLGSSGAVVAAIYDQYALIKETELYALKQTLAAMESVFHGSGSGLDPLVSYLGRPVMADDDGNLGMVEVSLPEGLFLADTGISRSTGPLVALFRKMMDEDRIFSDKVNHLKEVNRQAIRASVYGHDLWNYFNDISTIQLSAFRPMIPAAYLDVWQSGLESGSYALKLCGAGGGGMILGMSAGDEKFPEGMKIIKLSPK